MQVMGPSMNLQLCIAAAASIGVKRWCLAALPSCLHGESSQLEHFFVGLFASSTLLAKETGEERRSTMLLSDNTAAAMAKTSVLSHIQYYDDDDDPTEIGHFSSPSRAVALFKAAFSRKLAAAADKAETKSTLWTGANQMPFLLGCCQLLHILPVFQNSIVH